ncbi:MAG: hypothetical protein ACI89J_003329, partial [Hyphomicrobiaceae bacterium]
MTAQPVSELVRLLPVTKDHDDANQFGGTVN